MLYFVAADMMKLLAIIRKDGEHSNSVLLYAHALALCPFLLFTQGF